HCMVPFGCTEPPRFAAELVAWDAAVLDAVRLTVRALLRTNTMPALYADEVARTNRIGVALTGIVDWAWLRFGVTFRDAVAPEACDAHCEPDAAWDAADDFWRALADLHGAAVAEADAYA